LIIEIRDEARAKDGLALLSVLLYSGKPDNKGKGKGKDKDKKKLKRK
jgi:hypothetical protein